MTKFHISLTEEPDVEDKETLHRHMKAYNDAVSEHHRRIRNTGARELALFVRDKQGEILGGLTASTYWGWLYVDDLWLHERIRGGGVGRELMRRAEEVARQRGCEHAYLQTFDFQARGFYEKLDYYVVGQLDDYPPGRIFYWMRKDFRSDNHIEER
jgi:GNAT superfamily N-acetyltransferase